MDSRTCFAILSELFPQIDDRIIKAVSLENGDDIDAALDFILNEVVPEQNKQIETENFVPSHRSVDNLQSASGLWVDSKQKTHEDTELFDEIILAGINPSKFDGEVALSSVSVNSLIDKETNNKTKMNSSLALETSHLHKQFYGETSIGERSLSSESDLSQSRAEIKNMPSSCYLNDMQPGKKTSVDIENSDCGTLSFKEENGEICSNGIYSGVSSMCNSETFTGQSLSSRGIANAKRMERENQSMKEMLARRTNSSPAHNETIKSLVAEPIMNLDGGDSEKGSLDSLPVSQPIRDNADFWSVVYNKENFTYMESDVKDSFDSLQSGSLSCSGVSSSCQIVDTDSLEGVISEAKKNKDALMEGMESIHSLFTKTHCEEAAAQLAKEEAAKGGLEILARVEELRQTLSRARETNDMHAGEVYGERAILATEARELRSRLVQLTAEKDSALRMINAMCGVLQARYEAAKKEREAALAEKKQKEATARKLLEMEEAVMAKVAQDSRNLELEVETNTKLRDFLIDRGHSVDALQGELSVLCQDVKLLEEQIDGGTLTVTSGFINRHYRGRDLGESNNIEYSISSAHQADDMDNLYGSFSAKSFSGIDDINALLNNSHDSQAAEFMSDEVHDSIEDKNTLSPVASYDRLVDSVPNPVALLTDSLVDHLTNGMERSTAETDMECHHESRQRKKHSTNEVEGSIAETGTENLVESPQRKHSFEQVSDDEWQMLEEFHEGLRKPGSVHYPSLSFVGKTKAKQS